MIEIFNHVHPKDSSELRRNHSTMFRIMVYKRYMMARTYFRSIIILCVLVPAACELVTDQTGETDYRNEKVSEPTCKIKYINYGTSFGECLGYCVNQIVVTQEGARMKKEGWDEFGLLPDIECSKPLGSGGIDDIRASIDLDTFIRLDQVIGCPDCADGGAEWIEISFDTTLHRVTFEYMREPKELASAVSMMREIMAGFTDCE